MKVHDLPALRQKHAPSGNPQDRPPALFLSHGSPIYLVDRHPVTWIWKQLGERLGQDFEAIVVVSAHSRGAPTLYGGGPSSRIAYDFLGFPKECYNAVWTPPGNATLASRLARELSEVMGRQVPSQPGGPLDHGVWLPLCFLWPDPTCPVFSLGFPETRDPAQWWEWGRQLRSLSARPYLWIGSGGLVHNLRALEHNQHDPQGNDWARQFADWVLEAAARPDSDSLIHPDRGPHAQRALPTLEHYGPLLTISALVEPHGLVPIHQAFDFGNLGLHILAEESARSRNATLPLVIPPGVLRHVS